MTVAPDLLLAFAGAAQGALALASLAIPRVLSWRSETARLGPLTRRVFWTYAAYVWTTHVAFALLSLLAPAWLLDGSALARVVAGWIALWWGARLLVGFLSFGRDDLPPGRGVRLAALALDLLFAGLALLYAAVAAGVVGTGPHPG